MLALHAALCRTICPLNPNTRLLTFQMSIFGVFCSNAKISRSPTIKASFRAIGIFLRESTPDQPAVIYFDPYSERSYTYAQVKNAAIDFGKGLKALWDWQKGDVLALYTPNSIDTPALTWGTHWAGGILTPANPGYNTDELAFQLKDSGAKALVTQLPFIKTAKEAAKRVGIPDNRVILLGDQRDPSGAVKHFTSRSGSSASSSSTSSQ